jgi:hypothetical protein
LSSQQLYIITDAFGYSGKHVAGRWLTEDHCSPTVETNAYQATSPQSGRYRSIGVGFHLMPKV